MDLASYYQGLFIQSSAQHEVMGDSRTCFESSPTSSTPIFSDCLSSPNPCWDLDSLHQAELYRFSNSNVQTSFSQNSPSKSINSLSDFSETCSPTRSSPAANSSISDIDMWTPFPKSFVQNHCPLPLSSPSIESERTVIDDAKASTRSPHTSTKKTGTRSRSKANARERKRMNRLNHGFHELRLKLPGRSSHRELSKIEALQVAHSYILQLATILQTSA